MTAKQFEFFLEELGACPEARKWARGKTLSRAWKTCERGDWLLWLCAKMVGKRGWPTHKQLVLASCDVVEPILKYVPAGEDRPRIAIETARKWARGKASLEDVKKAASAAYAYAADAAYAGYAASAAYAASTAYADAAAYAAYAARAAYAAAYAYAVSAAYAADAATVFKGSAYIVRKRLKVAA